MTKRLFIAIKLQVNEEIEDLFEFLRCELSDCSIKWVDPNQIHITLKFLGNTDLSSIPAIKKNLASVATEYSAFDISLLGIGVFSNYKNPKVVWIGIDKCETANKLFDDIDNKMNSLGFETEKRGFNPHLTLGRIKQVGDTHNFQQTIESEAKSFFGDFHISSFHLFESELRPQGPVYTIIDSYKFK